VGVNTAWAACIPKYVVLAYETLDKLNGVA
jgi:hypothetical protein